MQAFWGIGSLERKGSPFTFKLKGFWAASCIWSRLPAGVWGDPIGGWDHGSFHLALLSPSLCGL